VDFLKFSFKKVPAVSALIAQKLFWLFMPPSKQTDPGHLLHEADWKQVAKRGTKLVMTLCVDGAYYYLGSNRRGGAHRAMVRLQSPLPPWFEFPETLDFRWL
jgi:hypothetical protein